MQANGQRNYAIFKNHSGNALHPVINIGQVLTETYFSRRIDFYNAEWSEGNVILP